jgi:hypothetical protein
MTRLGLFAESNARWDLTNLGRAVAALLAQDEQP